MTVDLDALELRAMRFQKLNPLHECFDSTTVLALIAELRQERERAASILDEATSVTIQFGGSVEYIEVDWLRQAFQDVGADNHPLRDAEAALSRAEEIIESVREATEHTMHPEQDEKRILTEYDKQKEAGR